MSPKAEGSRQTILVVDNDEKFRNLVSTTLAGADFRVLEARSGLEGISTMRHYDGEIALAVLEIKIPGISGLDLANQIGIERPNTEVLYTSDLIQSIAVQSISLEKPEAVLRKPFTAPELLARVRQFISRKAA